MSYLDTIAWPEFIAGMALKGRRLSVEARTLKKVGGLTPTATRAQIAADLEFGRIDGGTYAARIESVDYLEDVWHRGTLAHEVKVDSVAWLALPGGGHMKKTFKEGNKANE